MLRINFFSGKTLNPAIAYTPLPYFRAMLFIAWVAIAVSCDDTPAPTPKPEKKYLLSDEKVLDQKAEEIKAIADPYLSPYPPLPEMSFDVEGYKIEYTSSYKGKPLTASGVVILPRSSKSTPIFGWQHGTITKKSNAPSEKISGSNTNPLADSFLGAVVASTGMIVVIPDYIGFGSSDNLLHPYIVEEVTAITVVDMLQAGRELAIDKGLHVSEKVILAGHSEGGYATMAAHKYLEGHQVDNIKLTASFPSAGVYDIKGMQEYLWDQEEYPKPAFLAYVLYSYKKEFGLQIPLDKIFQEPYAQKIPALFDNGKQDINSIDLELTTNLTDLLTPNIRQHIETDPQYAELVNSLRKNSLTNWAPTIKMYMYHSKEDKTIPYSTSQATYDSLISHGASSEVVKLTYTEYDHLPSVIPYVAGMLKEIHDLQ